MTNQNDQIYVGCKVKLLRGRNKDKVGIVDDYSVEDDYVDVKVDNDDKSCWSWDMSFKDVEFVE
jgi:hypothetical protein